MSLSDGLRDGLKDELQARARVATEPLVVVTVGSQIRVNTSLLQQIHQRSDHRSPLVEVERLIREVDGSITVWIKTAGTVTPIPHEADVPLPWPESPI